MYTTKGRREHIVKEKPVNEFYDKEAKGSLQSIFKRNMTFFSNMHTDF